MDSERNRISGRQLTPEEKAIRRKKLKRKRNFRIALVVVCFALIIGLIASPIIIFAAFRVKAFTVDGEAPYTKEEIIAASGIAQGKNLIFADIDEGESNIEKELPYTDNVKITRKLPSTIVIRVESTEKKYAIMLSNGTYALLDKNLKVLEFAPQVPEKITVIKGAVPVKSETGEILAFTVENPDDKSKEETPIIDRTLSLILEIASGISENTMEDINLIDVSSSSNIYLIYQGRIVLNLGDSSNIPSKLSLGKRVIAEENSVSLTQSGTINLTVSKKAYFSPSDPDDIKELVLFNGGEWNESKADISTKKSEQ